eukprot:CAMPEP_0194367022 /NCGR_PEP_ID=MMETSP0174-20130528/15147_1 /TAXON_ID=216777 /ORGANISM="Proboscia alata, Strain PI-D3" /LENGTH=610 /DNA_ID=CAMNT_0039142583 /DNA_START=157 /DNA_END=1989 /DNA_ORIENTATION=-
MSCQMRSARFVSIAVKRIRQSSLPSISCISLSRHPNNYHTLSPTKKKYYSSSSIVSSSENNNSSNDSAKKSNDALVLCGGSNGTNYYSSYWSSGRCTGVEEDVRIVTRRPQNYVPFTPCIVATEPGDMIDASSDSLKNKNKMKSDENGPLSSLSSSLSSLLSPDEENGKNSEKDSSTYKSGPIRTYIYDDIDAAVSGASSVWISAPVSAYKSIFESIMPALGREGRKRLKRNEPPLVLMVMYAQGGVDWMIVRACGGVLPDGVVLGLLKNFPSLIKTLNIPISGGVQRHVTNLGFAPDAGHFASVPSSQLNNDIVSDIIRRFLPTLEQERGRGSKFENVENILAEASARVSNMPSPIPHVYALPSPLLCTLGAPNQFLHPAAIAGYVGPPPGRTFAEAPFFYKNNDPKTFTKLANIWCESAVLSQKCESALQISGLFGLFGATRLVRGVLAELDAHLWPLKIRELFASFSFRFSARLHAARLPMVPVHDEDNDKEGRGSADKKQQRLRFDTNSRAIVDDIGHGLVVLLGIAKIVKQDMPHTMQLVLEQQVYVKKEFVVFCDGKLVLEGRDLHESGAPQAYGVNDLEGLRGLVTMQKMNLTTNVDTTNDEK